jgi:hypothetical protein
MAATLTCPSCGRFGESGLAEVGPPAEFEIRGQLRGKPVRKCKNCHCGFTAGRFRTKRIDDHLWARMEESWAREFGAPAPPAVPPPSSPLAPITEPPQSVAPALAQLTEAQKDEVTQRLMAALDDVLIDAAAEAEIDPGSWNAGNQEFFITFTRGILLHALAAYDQTRLCGATREDQPYLQLLFGLRPALEAAGDAWAQAVGTVTEQSPIDALVSLAGPFQMVVSDKVADDQAFMRVQQHVFPEL